jgi:hypothetical protein
MHVFKRSLRMLRFRCSKYPACRTYTKVMLKE